MRPKSKLLVGVALLAMVAGCTTSTAGTAEPTPVTSSETSETSEDQPAPTSSEGGGPTVGAPAVDRPLDVERFQEEPCDALTAAQLARLALDPTGRPGQEVLGRSCDWRHPDGRGSVQLTFLDTDGRGLGVVYGSQAEGKLVFFEELAPVDGYPAVAYGVVDDREIGGCSVAVGVNNQVAYDISLVQSSANTGRDDPCDVAAMVAGLALETMRGA